MECRAIDGSPTALQRTPRDLGELTMNRFQNNNVLVTTGNCGSGIAAAAAFAAEGAYVARPRPNSGTG